jgi:hypothetical protein
MICTNGLTRIDSQVKFPMKVHHQFRKAFY